ncbi:MAG: YbhB/YbcL family Raf kinase inhibitor-like protein [Actinobacteria bacterium HGW-Actinobacteria-4]|nr:MAG: YbhB/YbcL family Raf kinase inhibitor-like protein [Actinobacteria bacterium HGW-Actinobacteria-4]
MYPSPPQSALRRMRIATLAIGTVVGLAGCAAATPTTSPTPLEAPSAAPMTPSPVPVPLAMTVTSDDFVDGGPLAAAFASCGEGNENLNPSLNWTGVPDGTQSFVIVVVDPDAGGYVHWVHANLPADTTSIEAGSSRELPGDSGLNTSGGGGYMGPCPPSPGHHYEYSVWALDTVLTFDQRPSMGHVLKESAGHIIGTGTIVGIY